MFNLFTSRNLVNCVRLLQSRPSVSLLSRIRSHVKFSNRKMTDHTLSSLRKWSCTNKRLPNLEDVKSLHVYDFDNTLFRSPLPNKQLWQGQTIGMLQTQECFVNGGWWHDANILKCTGEGLEKEEPRGWKGWWHEQVVELVELSVQQEDAVTVLLTGRSESGFADIIKRMVGSKRLDFDMIVLRPKTAPSNQSFASTMNFKQTFLQDLVETYKEAEEIRVYEDRPRHVTGFREFFVALNHDLLYKDPVPPRKPIQAEVIEVSEEKTALNQVTEVAEVQRMINSHNSAFREGRLSPGSKPWEIKRNVLYTGYLISPHDTERLLEIANLPSSSSSSASVQNRFPSDIRTLANNVLITTRPCPKHILDKVGGMGKRLRWRVQALGVFDNKVWAAKVAPVPSTSKYYCENGGKPIVVLALSGLAKAFEASRIQSWTPVPEDKVFEFDTEVGEKVLLRIEEESKPDGVNGHSTGSIPGFNNQGRGNKRPRLTTDEDFPPLGAPAGPADTLKPPSGPSRPQNRGNASKAAPNQPRNFHSAQRNDRGGRGGVSQRGGRGGGRGATSGPGARYRSLDDIEKYSGHKFGETDNSHEDEGLMY